MTMNNYHQKDTWSYLKMKRDFRSNDKPIFYRKGKIKLPELIDLFVTNDVSENYNHVSEGISLPADIGLFM